MAEISDEGKGILDAQFTSREVCHAANFMDAYGHGENCALESPKQAVPPPIIDHAPTTEDSSESICRVDLPNDLIVSSPMKISDILSLLLESPEKSAAANDFGGHGNGSTINELGIHLNGIKSPNEPAPNHSPLLRRSHSCQVDDGRMFGRVFQSGNAVLSDRSLSERSKSLDDIHACHQQPTSSSMHPWFPSISVVPPAVDALNDIYEAIHADQHKSGPSVNILGYSLPLVSVDGDSADYVCVTDVFQTFFSTRHWDEFKTILEKNEIRSVSTAVSSNDNAFGMPEIVDVIDVKQVESLLLSNQARKDGFVRCVRLSLEGETSGVGSPSSTAPAATESKIIMMPERHVGELSSGIRTRHADQSDIVYVELDGQTLPSIMLNGVQYVRLVDVQQKFLMPRSNDNKPHPSPSLSALAKQLLTLKSACATLKINVQKCKPNEKARMVVYAHSCHSSSLHIIAADQLPRLIQFIRHGKDKKSKKPTVSKAAAGKRSKASGLVNGNGSLRISIKDDWSSDFSQSMSTLSGSSSTSSTDSLDGESSSSVISGLLSAPASPIEATLKSLGTKRRATLDGRSDSARKRSLKTQFSYLQDPAKSGSGSEIQTANNSPLTIWTNGHLKKYSNDASSPVCFNLDDSMIFEDGPVSKVSGADGHALQDGIIVVNPVDNTREDDNLLDVLTPKGTISPCRIIVHHSPALPVVVYDRRGTRGPAGKYYDHLFVSKNAECTWCFGCSRFLNLREFINHGHDQPDNFSSPQLFMWVANVRDANLDLWKCLVEKAKKFRLGSMLGYNLPATLGEQEGEEEKGSSGGTSAQPRSGKASKSKSGKSGSRRAKQQIVLGGAPTPPPPPAFRRRQVRGDAFLDVMERYSTPGFKPPLTADVVGLHSDDTEKAVDAAYAV